MKKNEVKRLAERILEESPAISFATLCYLVADENKVEYGHVEYLLKDICVDLLRR